MEKNKMKSERSTTIPVSPNSTDVENATASFSPQLNGIKLFHTLVERRSLFYCDKINNLFHECNPLLESISILLGNKVDHGLNHTLRILDIISDILTDEQYKALTDVDIAILIMAALIHDIGLVYDADENIINQDGYEGINIVHIKQLFNQDCNKALQYIIHRTRDARIEKVIERNGLSNCFIGQVGENLLDDILPISRVHDLHLSNFEEHLQAEQTVDGGQLHQAFIANLLRLAEILDYDIIGTSGERDIFNLDDLHLILSPNCTTIPFLIIKNTKKIRTSTQIYFNQCKECSAIKKEVYIQSVSYERLKKSIKNMSQENYDDIQRRIIDYVTYIEKELKLYNYWLNKLNSKFYINLEKKVVYDCQDLTERIPNHRIDIDYTTTVSLLLGENIYGNRRTGLREIVQNSFDACKYRMVRTTHRSSYTPTITIELDYQKRELRVIDNGVGMNRFILENYFLKIGQSFYSSEIYKESNHQFLHAGHFGIGFFATFMLSDHVEIVTRHMDETDAWAVLVSTKGRYASISKTNQQVDVGTTIKLNLNEVERNFNIYNRPDFNLFSEIKYYLARYFLADIDRNNSARIIMQQIDEHGNSGPESLVPIESINNTLGTGTDEINVSLSTYLNGIDCLLRIAEKPQAKWFIYKKSGYNETFEPFEIRQAGDINSLIYKKIYYNEESIYLYVPSSSWPLDSETGEKIKPFNYDGIDRQSAYMTRKEIVFGNITVEKLFESLGWELPDFTRPIMGYVGQYTVISVGKSVVLCQSKAEIEQREPRESVTLNGRSYLDSIYVRNVYIPNFHVQLPLLIVMIDDCIVPEIKKMIINIEKEGVYPTIDRNDLLECDKQLISEAINIAILKWFSTRVTNKSIVDIMKRHIESSASNKFVLGE